MIMATNRTTLCGARCFVTALFLTKGPSKMETGRNSLSPALTNACLVVIGAVVLCSVLWFNHQPLFFPDTLGYLRTASHAFEKVFGSDLTVSPGVPEHGRQESEDKWAGRSAYYGALLYLSALSKDFRPVVLLQSLLCSWLVFLSCKVMLPRLSARAFAASIITLGLLTSAPFYVAFLMPDIFAGFALIAIALLFVQYDRLAVLERLALFALLAAGCMFHTTITAMTLLLLALVWAATRLLSGLPFRLAPAALVATACAAGIAGTWAIDFVTEKVYGNPPIWPPFVLARVVADGPGRIYLREHCGEEHFTLCRYLDSLPATSDDFLWRMFAEQATSADRRAILREQWQIVVPAVLANPGMQVEAALRNWIDQIRSFGITGFAADEETPGMVRDLLPAYYPTYEAAPIPNAHIDLRSLSALQYAVVLLSLGIVAAAIPTMARRTREPDPEVAVAARRHLATLGIITAGVLLNAAITGALSGPSERYEARLIWTVPLFAVLTLAARTAWARIRFAADVAAPSGR
jgi:hypothetical protein